MKLIFFLLVFLKNGMNPTEGIRVIYSSDRIIFKYFFNPNYNSNEKACCKFDQLKCLDFVTNREQVAAKYRGRIFSTNYNGQFEVIIIDLSVMDAGVYGCGFRGYPDTYEYVEVAASDLRAVTTAPLLPKSSIKPAAWPFSSPSTPIVSENDTEKHSSDSWRTSYTLAAVLTVLMFAVVSMTLLVYRLKTRKKKSTDKREICGSPNASLEQDSIIYSMVVFKPHQDPCELYANLQIQPKRH